MRCEAGVRSCHEGGVGSQTDGRRRVLTSAPALPFLRMRTHCADRRLSAFIRPDVMRPSPSPRFPWPRDLALTSRARRSQCRPGSSGVLGLLHQTDGCAPTVHSHHDFSLCVEVPPEKGAAKGEQEGAKRSSVRASRQSRQRAFLRDSHSSRCSLVKGNCRPRPSLVPRGL